jgi:hypothetical protein
MNVTPLFPSAIDAVTAHFESLGEDEAVRIRTSEKEGRARVWRLAQTYAMLNGGAPTLVLPHDFPLSPVRVEVDASLCLVLPHIDADGNVCLGFLADPADLGEPVAAFDRVLGGLTEYLAKCQVPGWVELEFHRERQDYWARYSAAARPPKGYRTRELLLDVDTGNPDFHEAGALALRDELRAVATSAGGGPEALARSRGWAVGTIIHGAALVGGLPVEERWTPRTWPRSFEALDELLSQISGRAGRLAAWYSSKRWPNKAAAFVALLQGPATFGWRILPPGVHGRSKPALVPIDVKRSDRRWVLSRDYQPDRLANLSTKRVVVFGCGSLGSPVIELLARAGVGRIEVVDPQLFQPENVARHARSVAGTCQRKHDLDSLQRMGSGTPAAA